MVPPLRAAAAALVACASITLAAQPETFMWRGGWGRRTPPRLPTAESFACSGLIAISTAAIISVTPIMFEVACKLKTLYIQLISGLVATSGWMPAAS